MNANATVAVLLATYNGSKYLPEFLESLIKQTHDDFTLFIRDDGSTDNTLDIIHHFIEKIEIRLLPGSERLGPAKSFITLLKNVDDGYDYYSFADQDDYWDKNKLERAVNSLSKTKEEPALYCSSLEYVNENLKHIAYSQKPRLIGLENALVQNIATGCTIVINQSARDLVLSSLPRFCIMHDWWLYLVVSAFGKIIYDDYPTIKYRQHANNTLGAATNVFQDVYRKLKRFVTREKGIFGLFAQTEEFKSCYSKRLSPEQLAMVDMILFGKSGLKQRLNLSVFSPFIRQKRLDTFILRILFLINRY